MTTRQFISALTALSLLCAGFYLAGWRKGKSARSDAPNVKKDTTVVWRTKTVTAPPYQSQTLQRWAFFTEEHRDTVRERELVPYAVHDTVYVPIVQRYYEELDGRLRLWISGWQPTLDRFELDERETVITRQKRWGFSVGVGPGVIYSPFTPSRIDAGIGLFGGLTYTF